MQALNLGTALVWILSFTAFGIKRGKQRHRILQTRGLFKASNEGCRVRNQGEWNIQRVTWQQKTITFCITIEQNTLSDTLSKLQQWFHLPTPEISSCHTPTAEQRGTCSQCQKHHTSTVPGLQKTKIYTPHNGKIKH